MLNRAYSFLHVKNVDGERRIITGVATTPTPDRMGDVVVPSGVKFKNPLPLLLYHNSQKPVGWVKFQKPTEDGIEFEAKLPTIDEPGVVRDRVEEAWTSIKSGLLAGVSIGFRSIEEAFNKETNGFRFLKTEVLELSLVAIPAQPDATIQTIKSLDVGLAATGTAAVLDSLNPAGVSATVRAVKVRQDRPVKKTISDQIKDFENTRAAKAAERDAIMEKASDEGVTLDAAQTETYDELDSEIKSIDAHLKRLRDLEESNKLAAKEVKGGNPDEASQSRSLRPVITVKDSLPDGLGLARVVLCKLTSFVEMQRGNVISALDVAKQRYPDDQRTQKYIIAKTAVAGGTTVDSVWAAPLLESTQSLEAEFLEYLRPQTIIGKFGTNGIPALRRVPFNIKIASQTTGGSANWVGEGKPKPLTKFEYADTTLLFTKIAAIAVITDELARFSRPGAEGLVRDALADAVIAKMDFDFIDPAKAVSAAVSPASITNGVTALTSAGTSAANVLTDIQNLLESFILNNVGVQNLVLIMPNTLAMVLSLTENSLGQPAFNGITITGGTLRGIPVITTQYAASGASFGNMVIAVNSRDIALADDGQVTVDVSREASLQMDDTPTNDSSTGTGQVSVSMWQTNSVAIRAERYINWKKLRTSAVAYMDDVNWGAIGSPV